MVIRNLPFYFIAAFFFTWIIVLPETALAKMYKWVDDQGKVHFTDSKSKIPPKYRKSFKSDKKNKNLGKSGLPIQPKGIRKEYSVVTKKGKTIVLKDFKVGFKEGGTAKGQESDSIPFGMGTIFGFFFTVPIIDPGDSVKIHMEVMVPLKSGAGKMKKIPFSLNFENPDNPENTGAMYVTLNEETQKLFMVPGNWTITLYNQDKPFVSQIFKVYLP